MHVNNSLAVKAKSDMDALTLVWVQSRPIREHRLKGTPREYRDDYRQQSYFAVRHAVRRYDPQLGNFDAYLGAWIRSVVDKYRPYETVHIPKWTKVTLRRTSVNCNKLRYETDIQDYRWVHRALAKLPGRSKRVVELHFGLRDGREWGLGKIAAMEKISRQRVQQIIGAALKQLSRYLRKEATDVAPILG